MLYPIDFGLKNFFWGVEGFDNATQTIDQMYIGLLSALRLDQFYSMIYTFLRTTTCVVTSVGKWTKNLGSFCLQDSDLRRVDPGQVNRRREISDLRRRVDRKHASHGKKRLTQSGSVVHV